MNRLLLFALLLAPCSLLHAQVVGPGGPYIREMKAGTGITITTNGYSRAIANPYTSVRAMADVDDSAIADNYVLAWSASATGHVYVAQGGHDPVTQGAGDIGTLTGQEYAVTTNAVRAAVSGLYVPLDTDINISGDAIRNDITLGQSIIPADDTDYTGLFWTSPTGVYGGLRMNASGGGTIWAYENEAWSRVITSAALSYYGGLLYAPLSTVTNLNASALTSGTVPDARLATKYRSPVLSWASTDFVLHPSGSVGWTTYENTSTELGADAISSTAADDQLATLRSAWLPVHATASAYKETGAIVISYCVNSTAGVTEIRGLRLMGRSTVTGSAVTVYTDTTTRDGDGTTAGALVSASIDRSAFTTTTLYSYLQVEVDVSCEDGHLLAIQAVEVKFE